MNEFPLDWRQLAAIAAALALLLGWIFYSVFRRKPAPEEIERRRRLHINQIGRIAEGRVVEILEAPVPPPQNSSGSLFGGKKLAAPPSSSGRKLVSYTYAVSGVIYSTAQDVTGFEARLHLDRLVGGQPASIKYDPSNPGNSILIADDWSGLR